MSVAKLCCGDGNPKIKLMVRASVVMRMTMKSLGRSR